MRRFVRVLVWVALLVDIGLLVLDWFAKRELVESAVQATQINTELIMWVLVSLVLVFAVDRILSAGNEPITQLPRSELAQPAHDAGPPAPAVKQKVGIRDRPLEIALGLLAIIVLVIVGYVAFAYS